MALNGCDTRVAQGAGFDHEKNQNADPIQARGQGANLFDTLPDEIVDRFCGMLKHR